MATLANIFNQFTGSKTMAGSAGSVETRERCDAYRLRAVPNEDVYFFVKRIDNSRVVKQADPRARARDWKLIGGASFAAASLIAVLLPSAYSLLAGYQLTQLQQENERLRGEQTRLELQEARLVSTERLQHLATLQDYVDPAAGKVVYLPKSENALALNQRR